VTDVPVAGAAGVATFWEDGAALSDTISARHTLLIRSRKFFVVCSSLDVVLRLGSDSHTL
jgi:hypothetical protein